MSKVTQNYRCSQCHRKMRPDQSICLACGNAIRDIHVSISEKVTMRANITATLRDRLSSSRNFITQSISGWFRSDRSDLSPDGVYKEQLVDRRNNKYKKKVVDAKTGRVIKDIEQKLSDHR